MDNTTRKLQDTVNRFCSFIESLPTEILVEQEWGPREVLAHLVFHHELYVQLVEGFISHTPQAPLQGRYREINALAVQINRGIPISVLLNRFQYANDRLLTLFRQYNPDLILVEIKAGVKLRTLRSLVPEIEAHIRNHLHKLQTDFLKTQKRKKA